MSLNPSFFFWVAIPFCRMNRCEMKFPLAPESIIANVHFPFTIQFVRKTGADVVKANVLLSSLGLPLPLELDLFPIVVRLFESLIVVRVESFRVVYTGSLRFVGTHT